LVLITDLGMGWMDSFMIQSNKYSYFLYTNRTTLWANIPFFPASATGNFPEMEVEYMHTSCANIMNECSYASTPAIHLYMLVICYIQGLACLYFMLSWIKGKSSSLREFQWEKV